MTAPGDCYLLPNGFQWDEPRPCTMCREIAPTYYIPGKVYLHVECYDAWRVDAGVDPSDAVDATDADATGTP